MFGLFAAQVTPPMYAVSYAGAERQINMYYYSYYLLLAGCLTYIEGWVLNKIKSVQISNFSGIIVSIVGAAIIVLGISINGLERLNLYKVSEDILSGNARQYDIEYSEVIEEINSQDGICYVEDIKQQTHSLDKFYIDKDPEYWVNKSLASYFGKEKIYLK